MTSPDSVKPQFTLYDGHDEAARLPLVAFERFMLLSDSKVSPSTFRVVMRFEGQPDRELMDQAFHAAISRQPLLRSRVSAVGHDLKWQPLDELPKIVWRQSESSAATQEILFDIPWIDLYHNPGISVEILQDQDGITIFLDYHHACTDGQGARQLIGEWLGIYAQLLTDGKIRLASIHTDRLQSRAVFKEADPPIKGLEALRNLFYTTRGRTIRLPVRDVTESARTDFGEQRVLTIDETFDLRALAKARGNSLNDIGLRASFQAFADCYPELMNSRHYLTVLHPVDLRTLSDLRSPACNRVGVCFLRRRPGEIAHPQKLGESVQAQMSYIKKRYVGAEFLKGLAWTGRSASFNQKLQSWGYFVPTVQYTYLGDTTRALAYPFPRENGQLNFSGLRLNHVSGIMQLGPFLPLSLTLCETSQKLAITARSHGKYSTQEQLKKFLDQYVVRLFDKA